MLVVRGEVSKQVTTTSGDTTGLGIWNLLDLVNRGNKVKFISAHQYVKSRSTLGTMCLQRRRCFLSRKIDVCPRKLFILHLTQFIAESISLRLEVILTLDENDHVVKGKLSRQLKNLGLVEVFCTKFNPEGDPDS